MRRDVFLAAAAFAAGCQLGPPRASVEEDARARLVAQGFAVGALAAADPSELLGAAGAGARSLRCAPARLDGHELRLCVLAFADGLRSTAWVGRQAGAALPDGTHQHAAGADVVLVLPVGDPPPPAVLDRIERAFARAR